MKNDNKTKCKCCRCYRWNYDFEDEDGTEYKSCVKCRTRKNKEYQVKIRNRVVENTDSLSESESDSDSENEFMGSGLVKPKRKNVSKRNVLQSRAREQLKHMNKVKNIEKQRKAKCGERQQLTLDNRCYDFDTGKLVLPAIQEYESEDEDSLFSASDDEMSEKEILIQLNNRINEVYGIMKQGSIQKSGRNYLDKSGKVILSDKEVEYFVANKYKLGRNFR